MTQDELNVILANKNSEIFSAFTSHINGTDAGYLSPSKNIHLNDSIDDFTAYNIGYQSMLFQGMTSRYINTKEGFISVTADELKTILGELALQGDTLWQKKEMLFSLVNSTTLEEYVADPTCLDKVVW